MSEELKKDMQAEPGNEKIKEEMPEGTPGDGTKGMDSEEEKKAVEENTGGGDEKEPAGEESDEKDADGGRKPARRTIRKPKTAKKVPRTVTARRRRLKRKPLRRSLSLIKNRMR